MSRLEKLTRRECIGFGVAALVSALSCKGKHHDIPAPVPGISPDEAYHTATGIVKSTEQAQLNASVSFRPLSGNSVFADATDQDGRYLIHGIPNGDHQLSVISQDFFSYVDDKFRVGVSSGTITKDFYLILRQSLTGTDYASRSLIEFLKDITGNRDGRFWDERFGTRPDSVQRVRRFDLSKKIKVYLGNSPPEVQQALSEWESELGRTLFGPSTRSNGDDANIVFSYVQQGPVSQTEIRNFVPINSVNTIKKAIVSIDSSLSSADVLKAARREIGYVLFGAERYSKDDVHAIFKEPDSSKPDIIMATGISDDEVKLFNAYYSLPIGEDLNPYRN